jgi:hypothetical protein
VVKWETCWKHIKVTDITDQLSVLCIYGPYDSIIVEQCITATHKIYPVLNIDPENNAGVLPDFSQYVADDAPFVS